MLLLLTLFLAINKEDYSKKKVLLGCTCFSKGCAAGGKQMVSDKGMGVCKQASCVASRAFTVQARGLV